MADDKGLESAGRPTEGGAFLAPEEAGWQGPTIAQWAEAPEETAQGGETAPETALEPDSSGQEPAEPPAQATVNPYTMSKAEFEAWAAKTPPEEVRKVLAEQAPDPLETIRLRRDYHEKTTKLAEERRRLEQEKEELLAQVRQLAAGTVPAPPEPPFGTPTPTGYDYTDPYAQTTVDPRVAALEAKVKEQTAALEQMQQQFRQMVEYEVRRDLKTRMERLSHEHPWFTVDEHENLYAYMRDRNIQDVETAFRSAYFDQLVAERVAAATQRPGEEMSSPSLAPKAPRQRGESDWRNKPFPRTAEEFTELLRRESGVREQ